jgi:outer membrane protein
MVNELLKDLTVVTRDYGKEKGFTLIVEKGQSGVIYSNDTADLTKEILERYNTRRSKK